MDSHIDGFLLLRNSILLRNRLHQLRIELRDGDSLTPKERSSHQDDLRLVAELSLLVEGVLADYQVFESFGFENLYEKGILTYEQWKTFQSLRTSQTLDELDRAFQAIDQEEKDFDLYSVASDDVSDPLASNPNGTSAPLEDNLGSQSKHPNFLDIVLAARYGNHAGIRWYLARASKVDKTLSRFHQALNESLIEAINHGHEQIVSLLIEYGASVDGAKPGGPSDGNKSPLIAAIYKGRNDIIAHLLAHGANPSIILQIEPDDQWLVAQSLIDNGADATWLLQCLLAQDLADMRLLHVLLNKGADVHATCSGWIPDSFADHQLRAAQSFHLHNIKLVNAVERGDWPLMRMQINAGAAATFGLDAALLKYDNEMLRFLLENGADPRYLEFGRPRVSLQTRQIMDTCLLMAADEGFTTLAISLLKFRNPVEPFVAEIRHHLSFTYYSRSARRSSLSKILRNPGIYPLFRLFLEYWDGDSSCDWQNPFYSVKIFSLLPPWSLHSPHPKIKLWRKSSKPTDSQGRQQFVDAIRLRCLHREFQAQYSRILACARASKNSALLPPRECVASHPWGHNFDPNYSKGWSRGLAVLRGLCREQVPSTLYDTLMFLALARAICISRGAKGDSDYHPKFIADLGRWQVLFSTEDGSLSAYQKAVRDIWRASDEDLERAHTTDSTSLIYFREIAMSLVSGLHPSLNNNVDNGNGLLASQEHWRMERVPDSPETKRPEPFDMQFPENAVERGRRPPLDTPGLVSSEDENGPQTLETQVPLRDAIAIDARRWTCNPIVILLIASFCFGAVLLFVRGRFPRNSELHIGVY